MQTQSRKVTWKDLFRWFDPRYTKPGFWGFILNRVTAIGLTFYLYLHLIMLSRLAQGPAAYENFLATIKSPLFIFGELLVVAAGLIHGLNGLRIIYNSFGYGIPTQKKLFYGLMAIAIIATIIFGIRMFTA